MLALLLALIYGYWYLTNDQRIRREAERYLSDMTGARVRIRHAEFRLFGGIELHGVRVRLPGDRQAPPLLRADNVVLRHNPWSLFTGQRLEPKEIVCVECFVTAEHYAETDEWNFMRLLELMRSKEVSMPGEGAPLPTVRVPKGTIQVVETEGAARYPGEPVPLSLTMTPIGESGYRIDIGQESGRTPGGLAGVVRLDVRTGDVSGTAEATLSRLGPVLPEHIRVWLKRYGIEGDFRLTRRQDPQRGALYEVELAGFTLTLPDAQGGLELTDVGGRILFDSEGATLREVSGRLPQAGGATFTLHGRYDGFQRASPFRVEIAVNGAAVPSADAVTGRFAETLARINESFQPAGRLDAELLIRRGAAGRVRVTGAARPRGMRIVYDRFPYRLEDVRGEIAILEEAVELREITARHGPARLTLNASLEMFHGRRVYDVRIGAEDVPLTEEFQAALQPKFLKIYERMQPSGFGSAEVRVTRDGEDDRQHVDVQLILDGRASLCYTRFPYCVDKLSGRVRIAEGNVEIRRLRGARGSARCTIDGTIEGIDDGPPAVDLRITAGDLPLDDHLMQALGDRSRAAMRAMNPRGSVEYVEARVTQEPGEPIRHDITATLKDVRIRPEAFPYEIVDTGGVLTVQGDRAIVELRGRHDRTPVRADGLIYFREGGVGVDLTVGATGLVFDDELFDALSPPLRKVWRQLSPSGTGDVTVTVTRNAPDGAGADDYRFELNARDMEITYVGFPYTFKGLTGRAVAVPGRIELRNMTFSDGDVRGTIEGVITSAENTDRGELSIAARNLPVDETLLSAMPAELDPLLQRVRTGGTVDLALESVRFTRTPPQAPTTAPATRPATAPGDGATTRPTGLGSLASWAMRGRVDATDVVMDVGLGYKTLTGSVDGTASKDDEGMAIDARVALDSVRVGAQRLTDLRGRMTKTAASARIRIDDLNVAASGGQLTGLAEIELSEPPRFGLRLSTTRGIDLQKMFSAAVEDPEKAAEVKGVLEGTLQYTASMGDASTRQAAGVLRISEAKLYRLPVLLELLHVIYLSLPGDSAFTDAYVQYHLRGDSLLFREIHLDGPALSLVGSGTLDLDTRALRLTFLSGPPGKLPRLEGLPSELLEGIVREIAEIRVTGTVSKPKMRTVSLPSLEDVIRRLVRPDGGE